MYYFAYGSNMSPRRLSQRVPRARALGAGWVERHELRFHKVGRDGSAKCDACFTGHSGHQLHGVLFDIDVAGKRTLDGIEGLGCGYEEKTVAVRFADGRAVEAHTYYATRIDARLLPFHWYREHVLLGAREMGLPVHHIALLESVATWPDPDEARCQRELSVYSLP
jgi:gamma-glutamylcyclotransferase